MPSPHLVLASSAIAHPSSHAASHSTAAAPLASTPSPIAAPNAVLDTTSLSQPRTYYIRPSHPPAVAAISDTDNFAASSNQLHIISALSASSAASIDTYDARFPPSQPNRTPFSAASLPRTSSLLPPARVTAQSKPPNTVTTADISLDSQDPFTAQTTVGAFSTVDPFAATSGSDTVAAASSRHRPSRSSSVDIAHNPVRDLNRWSNSTGSTRTSATNGHPLVHRHQRSASFSRRLSVDSIASQFQAREFGSPVAPPSGNYSTVVSAPPAQQTPRKLQKSRPATANSGSPLRESPGARVSRQPPAAPIPPFESLPPIIALPSLEQEVQGGTASLAGRMTPQQRRPHLRQLSSEDNIQSFYFGDAPPISSSMLMNRAAPAQAERQEYPAATLSKSRDGASAATSAMPYSREPEAVQASRGYVHSRSQNAKGSTDSTRSKDRASRPPSQKAMLSRALQKANMAVQLDNAGNIEGAREAYAEACELLHQVLLKTPGEEDKRKLEAIRVTYTARIEELDQLASTQKQDTRPLPRRPRSNSARGRSSLDTYADEDAGGASDEEVEEEAVVETATVTRIYNNNEEPEAAEPRSIPSYSVPLPSSSPALQQSSFVSIPNESSRHVSSLLSDQYTLQSSFSRSPRKDPILPNGFNNANLQPPAAANPYMPPPLSPRRVAPPPKPFDEIPPAQSFAGNEYSMSTSRLGSDLGPSSTAAGNSTPAHGHTRGTSHESVSWLDPINESGSSAASSVHSRSSSMRIRRKHIRAASGATEAEFDAALDDAIEAAYDDGYEPMNADAMAKASSGYRNYKGDDSQISQSLRKVELAKQRVRESEREALAFERQLRLREQLKQQEEEEQTSRDTATNFLDAGDDSEEEERMLEEMTNGYAIEDFSLGSKGNAKPPPRASDSSEFTTRTWHSSMASNPPTATTILSTVSENTVVPASLAKGSTNTMPPPPTHALPQLPPQQTRPPTAQSPVRVGSAQSVRNRRLSGQNMKQLKIETTQLSPPSSFQAPATAGNSSNSSALSASAAIPQQPRTAGFLVQQRQALSAGPTGPVRPGSSARQVPTPSPSAGATMFFGASPIEMPPPNFPPPTPPIPQGTPFTDDGSTAGRSGSPSTGRPVLRKNFSSSSLRSMRSRNISVTNLEGGSDISPGTPLSNQFVLSSRLPDVPTLPTPIATTFKERMNVAASGVGGLHLLESDFHSPSTPGSPNPMYSDAPVPLEACPTDTMLRPFWLMRCLYQTLVHPRGGYLSNKLFVPTDVWKVKGVKLRNLDEKISNCDLLTAALLKLARVDTCDADAVLEEMQSLEGVLEQVQTVLSRKLGNEVGVQSANSLFKDASASGENEQGAGAVPRTSSVSGNSRSFSWRRLRSKNSSAGLGSSYAGAGRKESISEGGSKDGGSLASLPMTTHPTSRPAKRDVASAKFTGPHATYMGALARLFDAAQSIDQIARQVEDPGLRHADKTQVGLELCTRHAAEFFAFYIIRFVLSDVSLLLEKFIKRGSEWVLA